MVLRRPHLKMGERDLFEVLAEHNVTLFKKFNAEKIVVLSPHCYNTFKSDKPYSEANLNVQHYTQFLAEAIKLWKTQTLKNRQ
jgi:Fe-S oxidoreductase